jgi:hypothetical protein
MKSMYKWKSLVSQVQKSNLAFIVLWTVFFSLAYSQAPLYTSNQNQYFLHGLAKAGLGYLKADWLANTLDPTPVFSSIVYASYRLLDWPPIFYIYFGILAGVYLFSLTGIADHIFGIRKNRLTCYSFMALLIGFHSAALRFLLVRLFDTNWAYLFDGGFAGQRLLGEVLQPSTFGVLLLLSIFLFLKRRILWAVLPLVLAPTVHPTYLLSAAVLTVGYMAIIFIEERNYRKPLLIGVLALLGVLPILLHTYLIYQPTAPYNVARARDLLVNFRIPHHALPAMWWDTTVAIKLVLIFLASYLTRKTRIFYLLVVAFLVGSVLTLAQVISQSNTLALLFPWRMSTFLVPLSVSMLLGFTVMQVYTRYQDFLDALEGKLVVGSLMAVTLLAVAGAAIFAINLSQKQNSLARTTFEFVAQNIAPGQYYLIPLDMQDFRLETGVPVYVEFKSIPYQDEQVLEWYRRVGLAGQLYQAPYQRIACDILDQLYAEGITHVILPYDHTAYPCPILERQFLEFEAYDVFMLSP